MIDYYKYIFITEHKDLGLNYWSIPKCANTTVKYCLMNPHTEKHPEATLHRKEKWVHKPQKMPVITAEQAHNNGLLNFTVVRNPYDRFISLYKDFGVRRPWLKEFKRQKVDLETFIRKVCIEWKDDTLVRNHHAFTQTFYITDENYNIQVDKIIEIKNLNSFLKKRGIISGVFNKTPEIDISLTHQQKEIVYKRFKNDFDLLGYEK